MFGSVRVIIMAVVFIGISGVGVYVMKLRSDNAILQANQIQLELSMTFLMREYVLKRLQI